MTFHVNPLVNWYYEYCECNISLHRAFVTIWGFWCSALPSLSLLRYSTCTMDSFSKDDVDVNRIKSCYKCVHNKWFLSNTVLLYDYGGCKNHLYIMKIIEALIWCSILLDTVVEVGLRPKVCNCFKIFGQRGFLGNLPSLLSLWSSKVTNYFC